MKNAINVVIFTSSLFILTDGQKKIVAFVLSSQISISCVLCAYMYFNFACFEIGGLVRQGVLFCQVDFSSFEGSAKLMNQ